MMFYQIELANKKKKVFSYLIMFFFNCPCPAYSGLALSSFMIDILNLKNCAHKFVFILIFFRTKSTRKIRLYMAVLYRKGAQIRQKLALLRQISSTIEIETNCLLNDLKVYYFFDNSYWFLVVEIRESLLQRNRT